MIKLPEPITETALKDMLKDRRYWTTWHPEHREYVATVSEGYKRLYSDKSKPKSSGTSIIGIGGTAGTGRAGNSIIERGKSRYGLDDTNLLIGHISDARRESDGQRKLNAHDSIRRILIQRKDDKRASINWKPVAPLGGENVRPTEFGQPSAGTGQAGGVASGSGYNGGLVQVSGYTRYVNGQAVEVSPYERNPPAGGGGGSSGGTSSGGTSSQATSGTDSTTKVDIPPVPKDKRLVFDRPEMQQDWKDFNLGNKKILPGNDVTQKVFRGIFALEGGMIKNGVNGAVAGMTKSTLEGMYRKGITDVFSDLGRVPQPDDIKEPERAVQLYKDYFNDVIDKKNGGYQTLETMPDSKASLILADTVFHHGGPDGTMAIQKAYNQTYAGNNSIDVDGALGSSTVNAYRNVMGDAENRRKFLGHLADRRIDTLKKINKGNIAQAEIDRVIKVTLGDYEG